MLGIGVWELALLTLLLVVVVGIVTAVVAGSARNSRD
jgi:hypothetical protein